MVQALRSNRSLTSLDVRNVVSFKESYEVMANVLLNPNASTKLGFLRCEAFEIFEGQKIVSLREKVLEPHVVRMLAGLLKKNKTLLDLDLTATDLEGVGAAAIAMVIEINTTLTDLRLKFNHIDDAEQSNIANAVKRRATPLRLDM